MKTRFTIFSMMLVCLSCYNEMTPPQEPCVESESIIDSSVKIYSSKNWNDKDKAFATKLNDTSYFKAYCIRYQNKSLIGLEFLGRNEDSIIYEDMTISNIPFGIGCYNVIFYKAGHLISLGSEYSINDDDVIIDKYYTDTTSVNNKIEITTLDSINKTIEGHFAISFVYANQRPKRNPNEPYNIRFFNGYFKGSYSE